MVSGTPPCPPHCCGWGGSTKVCTEPCRTEPYHAKLCHAKLCHAELCHAKPSAQATGASGAGGNGAAAVGPARQGSGRARGRESAGGRLGSGGRGPASPPGSPAPAQPRRHWGGDFFTACFTASRKGSFWKPRLPARHSRPARCRLHAPRWVPRRGRDWGRAGAAARGQNRARLPRDTLVWPGRPAGHPRGSGACRRGGGSVRLRCRFPGPRAGCDRAPAHTALPALGPGRPAQEGANCLKPHPDTHPRGILEGLAGERGPA